MPAARRLALALLAAVALPASAADPARTDAFGDPLPPGAVARLGTARATTGRSLRANLIPPLFDRAIVRDPLGEPVVRDLTTGAVVCRPPSRESKRGGPTAFAADGKRAVSVLDRELVVWDAATGRVLHTIKTGAIEVRVSFGSALSADGSVVVACEQPPPEWIGRKIPGGAFAPPSPKEVVVRKVATGDVLARVSLGPEREPGFTLSGDGRTLVTWDDTPLIGRGREPAPDRTMTVRDVATGKAVASVPAARSFRAAVLSTDGALLARVNDRGRGELFDAHTGKALPLAAVPAGRERADSDTAPGAAVVDFSPDGKTLAGVGRDLTTWRWATADGKLLDATPAPLPVEDHPTRHVAVALPANDKAVAAAEVGQTVVAWEFPSGKLRTPLGGHTRAVTGVGFRAGGKEVVTGAEDGRVVRWDATTGKQVGAVAVRPEVVVPFRRPVAPPLRISPDAARGLCDGTGDNLVLAFDLTTGAQTFALPPRGWGGGGAVPSPDFTKVAGFVFPNDGNNGRFRCSVWEAASGKKVIDVEPLAGGDRDTTSRFRTAAFSPDGTRLLTVVGVSAKRPARGAERPAGLPDPYLVFAGWDVATGRKLGEWVERGVNRIEVVAAASGTSAVVTSPAQTNGRDPMMPDHHLWALDFEAGRRGDEIDGVKFGRRSLDWGSTTVLGPVAFSADGKRFAVGGPFGDDGEVGVRLYDWPSGKVLRTFLGHSAAVTALNFSPDGTTLASGSVDTTVLLWDVANVHAPMAP